MAKSIEAKDLGGAIGRVLETYGEDVLEKVNQLSEYAVKELVNTTKSTAPVLSGDFKKSIASKRLKHGSRGDTYVWYVKAPNHRITHLIVHGHALRNGGRAKGNTFLQNALDTVLPKYEAAVEEALKE